MNDRQASFENVLRYYKECFQLVDCFHFNSEISRKVYEENLGSLEGYTVPISHFGIQDHRLTKKFSVQGLVLGFIGSNAPYKGLDVLIKTVNGLNVDVMIWGGVKKEQGQIHYRGKFVAQQLADIYNEIDMLVVPSIWKETFSLVTLEALSYGVPVLVSDNVGAQDIVKEYAPKFVYHSADELRKILVELIEDKSLLIDYNKKILSLPWKHDVLSHAQDIIEKIYK